MASNFIVYLIGYFLVIAGIVYGMMQAGIGSEWIIAVVLVMAGLGIVYAMSRSQAKQSEPREHDRNTP